MRKDYQRRAGPVKIERATPKEYVIDCDSKILGRLASGVAKLLLQGHRVILVNAEKAAMSGHPTQLAASYKRKLELVDKANPEHSPYWSRRPDLLVKRIIRGMLPYKRPKGKEAFKRLTVYVGVPHGVPAAGAEKLEFKNRRETFETTITVKELTQRLGYGAR
jgi:large subunit ribosomal protein L13